MDSPLSQLRRVLNLDNIPDNNYPIQNNFRNENRERDPNYYENRIDRDGYSNNDYGKEENQIFNFKF